ncbi:hypothetical protein HON52_04660 [Candidatus Uhrbacteria bacterium]|jgi:hypothetical protein|nr:hypothetical protein [Candidatus Uhrbacteria bacterium]
MSSIELGLGQGGLKKLVERFGVADSFESLNVGNGTHVRIMHTDELSGHTLIGGAANGSLGHVMICVAFVLGFDDRWMRVSPQTSRTIDDVVENHSDSALILVAQFINATDSTMNCRFGQSGPLCNIYVVHDLRR